MRIAHCVAPRAEGRGEVWREAAVKGDAPAPGAEEQVGVAAGGWLVEGAEAYAEVEGARARPLAPARRQKVRRVREAQVRRGEK